MNWLKRLLGQNPKPGEVTQEIKAFQVEEERGADVTMLGGFQAQEGAARMIGAIKARKQAQAQGARGFLHVYEGPSTGSNFFLSAKPVTIGRKAEQAGFVVPDPGVSSRHCEVRPDGGGFKLVDLGSKNGTFVNDQRVTEKAIQNGDLLAFGETRIYVGIL